jgi:hypothetical protein
MYICRGVEIPIFRGCERFNAKLSGLNAKLSGLNAKLSGLNAKLSGLNANKKTKFFI